MLSCDLAAPRARRRSQRLLAAAGRRPARDVLGAVPVVDGHHQWTHVVWRRAGPRAAADAARRRGAARCAGPRAGLPLCEVLDLDPARPADADTPPTCRPHPPHDGGHG